jgi:hypothetical protein
MSHSCVDCKEQTSKFHADPSHLRKPSRAIEQYRFIKSSSSAGTSRTKNYALSETEPDSAVGVPGSLKNALEWAVGSGELSGKPVVLVNASSRGVYAQASLREILKTMDARVLTDFELTMELLGKDLEAEAIAEEPMYADVLKVFLKRVSEFVQ